MHGSHNYSSFRDCNKKPTRQLQFNSLPIRKFARELFISRRFIPAALNLTLPPVADLLKCDVQREFTSHHREFFFFLVCPHAHGETNFRAHCERTSVFLGDEGYIYDVSSGGIVCTRKSEWLLAWFCRYDCRCN